jgi:hypothetical protein
MGRGVLLTSNLPQLQNLIKRDPVAYKEEFLQQWNHYDSIRQMFKINPEEQAQHFKEIVAFISQVRLNKSIIHHYILKKWLRLQLVIRKRQRSFLLKYLHCCWKVMVF